MSRFRIARRSPPQILPTLRGMSSNRRVIAHYTDHEDALTLCRFQLGRGTREAGHELSGSFSADAHLPDVYRLEAG